MPRNKVAIIDTIGKTEEKTEKNIQKESSSIDNSISIQHTKVIYQGVISSVRVQLSKLLDSF